MNRFTRWQRWLAALGLGALLAVGSCTDDRERSPTGIEPLFQALPGGWDLFPDTVEINGGVWISGVGFKVGTGVINPFLGIQQKDQQEGFNTDGKFNYDQTRSNFTDPLPLNVVSQIELEYPAGTTKWYRELILDANEADAAPAAHFSIEEFELYLCYDGTAPETYENYDQFASNPNCSRIYDFRENDANKTAYATDGKTNGSGNSLDYYILIPEDYFDNFLDAHSLTCYYNPADDCGVYVILWNQMGFTGGEWVVGSTFEEYSTLVREVPTGFKNGYKWHDLNADGTKDEGEPGLQGWTIELLKNGTPYATTTTNESGYYEFLELLPGDYTAREVCPAGQGWVQSFPTTTDGCGSGVYDFTVFVGDLEHPDNNFGNWRPATKSGMKFEDLNANGAKDAGEGGLSGWTIYVDYDDDGVLDAGEPSAVTGGDGTYSITGINPGTWKVREVAQAGWTCSYPDPCYYDETFSSGDALTGNDFGNYTSATKAGTKFEDEDADGVRDAGEAGLAGWTIYVDYNDNDVLDAGEPSAVTVADGSYLITGINPGTWTVKEVPQSDWTCSYPTPCYHQETFTSSAALTGNDFGNWYPATKAGMKFEDEDADGLKDAGELGLSGWTIFVDYDDDGVLDAGEPSDVTAGDGSYLITGITPGPYKVREVAQAGWTCSFPDPCYHEETFTSSDALTDNDFGNWYPATKAGMKFEDENADGVKDAGEGGLSGWTIYVDYDDDGVLDAGEPSDVTAADGSYLITGINPGNWKVKEILQAGWTCSFPSPCYHQETFTSSDALTGNDFGNWYPATKSGMKFEDADADGVKDAGESGLSGWTIYVDYDDDGVLDAGEPSAVTGAGGTYTITGITPGTYKVREVAQAGWTCSYPDPCYHEETFTSSDALTNNDFGNYTSATKAGTKFEDEDADGVREAGEGGLAGWTIFVDYDDNDLLDAGEPSDVTGADGSYLIEGIKPGTWKVKEVPQSDWTCSYPSPCYHQETFTSSAALIDNDFGNWHPATKAGMKFEDEDADGVKDAGEGGLGGWTIYVDYDDDDVLDAGEPSDVTAGDGSYLIEGIVPGNWKVKEILQAGWTCSFPSPCYHQETFTSSDALTNNDFGNWYPASKAGMKFEDEDADGVKDAGDGGLSGWTIYVDYDDDGVLDAGEPSAVTGAGGAYTITGILPGTYKVREVAQAGWTCSYPSPCYHSETFTSSDALTGNDFGNWRPASKAGMKFEDADADGVKAAGELGLSGWTIYVDYDDDGVLDGGEPSAVTGAGGTYTINGINPGAYKVREVAQAGWTCSYPNPCYHQETFTSGDALTDNDFGNWQPATKAGMKFEDADADGVKDAGELGLSGWTIYVDYDDDGVLDAGEPSAVTGAGGTYTITGITPGTHKVREVAQAGWTCSYPSPCYHDEVFTSGAALTDNDFGNWYPASKSGFKWNDLDHDGVWDAGELGLAGWSITLTGTDGMGAPVTLSTTTGADGSYSFPGLTPGAYAVCETPQLDWVQTWPTAGYACSNGTVGYAFNLVSGQNETDNNFGNFMPPNAETAWAANGTEPGFLRYLTSSNWATFVEYAEKTTNLYAGQTHLAGTVHFGPVAGGNVQITITLGTDWQFESGGVVNLMIEGYDTAPYGINPAPGQFRYKFTATASPITVSVPAYAFYGVHALVVEY